MLPLKSSRKSRSLKAKRSRGFISVGALCQGSEFFMADAYRFSLSESCFPSGSAQLQPGNISGSDRKQRSRSGMLESTIFACEGGTHRALSRREASMTRRLNSSLRSHRTPEAQCSNVCSGLNKTLFASVGPNSHGRGHRLNKAGPSVMSPPHKCEPGRIKPNRGLRADETSFRMVTELLDVVSVPPNVSQVTDLNWDQSCRLALLSSLSHSGLVGPLFVTGGLLPLVNAAVTHHGEKDAQKPTGHGHVGLGLSDPLDQSLTDRFLAGVGTAQGNGGLAQRPAQSGVTSLGDVAGLGTSGGLFIVGCQSGPELQRIGIGKTREVSDLRGNDAPPYLVNARHTLEQPDQLDETGLAIGGDDATAQRFALAFQQGDEVQKITEGFPLNVFEQVAMGQEPLLSRGGIELGAGNIRGQQDRSHAVLDAGKRARKAVPVSPQLAKLGQVFIGDPAQRTVSPRQAGGDVGSIVPIVLSPLAAQAGQCRGIGDVHAGHAGAEPVDEPFTESDGLDGQAAGLWLYTYPLLNAFDAFGMAG
jgi:hypothetical protein